MSKMYEYQLIIKINKSECFIPKKQVIRSLRLVNLKTAKGVLTTCTLFL